MPVANTAPVTGSIKLTIAPTKGSSTTNPDTACNEAGDEPPPPHAETTKDEITTASTLSVDFIDIICNL
jgi:hypothetical protein